MNKDWIGNSRSVHSTLGARNYALEDREQNDYYATDPKAARLLMEVETFAPTIWECACGEGHLAKEFEAAGYRVFASDLIDRGSGAVMDFFTATPPDYPFDIVTNPPYTRSVEFVEHALDVLQTGRKAAMFLKIQFLEGKARRKLFERCPPRRVYVSSSRLVCAKNGDFKRYAHADAVGYAWYVWEKGYTGETVLKWIN